MTKIKTTIINSLYNYSDNGCYVGHNFVNISKPVNNSIITLPKTTISLNLNIDENINCVVNFNYDNPHLDYCGLDKTNVYKLSKCIIRKLTLLGKSIDSELIDYVVSQFDPQWIEISTIMGIPDCYSNRDKWKKIMENDRNYKFSNYYGDCEKSYSFYKKE